MWPGCNLQGAEICCVGQLCHTAVLSSGIQAVFIPIVITDEEHSVIPPALSLGKVGRRGENGQALSAAVELLATDPAAEFSVCLVD